MPVASNLAKEHARRERGTAAHSTSMTPWCKSSSPSYPPFSASSIRAARQALARGPAAATAQVPRGGSATVLAWHELRGDRTAARDLHPHGQEVPEPGTGALSAPHGAAEMSPMSGNNERVRDFITEEAADWFVANRADLNEQESADFAAWLKASPAHVEEYLASRGVARDLRAACDTPENSIEQIVARASSQSTSDSRSGRALPPRAANHFLPWWHRAALTLAILAVVSFGLFAPVSLWPAFVGSPDRGRRRCTLKRVTASSRPSRSPTTRSCI